jgi:hypothetical protein
MDFPVYELQAILSKPVVDWAHEIAQKQSVSLTVVLNALLMYAMYDITTQDPEGRSKLRDFIQTLHTSTPVKEEKLW